MSDYPVPFCGESDGRWHEDMNEDYRNAKDDNERRQILLSFGYDKAHEAEVYRLFGPLPSEIPPHSGDEPQHTHPPKRKRSIDEKSLRWTIAGVLIAGVGVLVSVLLAIFL